ncbi:SAVED domain-containing protein [Leptospira interrogans serovar Szwajizak]|uniref:SAVED domain-containing protein n=1 Tax=Leptospira interrogans TaxID=173 RepID=UPI001E586C1C|nr:SAVED domain-containing protein [Leptospira interrogans]
MMAQNTLEKLILIDGRLVTIDKERIFREFENSTSFFETHFIQADQLSLENWESIDWGRENQILLEEGRQIKEKIKEKRETEIHYFGLTSIPSAFYLGSQFGSNLHQIRAYNRNHKTKEWGVKNLDSSSQFKIEGLPIETSPISGDVVLIIESSYEVNRKEIERLLPYALRTISISSTQLDPDGLSSANSNELLSQHFIAVLNSINEFIPKCETIHLFTSIPCGASFLLGSKWSPTVHCKIQTYHYTKNNKNPFQPAICFEESEQRNKKTDTEIKLISELKDQFAIDFKDRIFPFLKSIGEKDWNILRGVDPEVALPIRNKFTKKISDIDPSHIASYKFVIQNVDVAYYNESKREWQIPEDLILGLIRLVLPTNEIIRGMRLFLFHELFHISQQLAVPLSDGISQFPEIIAAVDRDADLFAMIAEWEYSSIYLASNIIDDRSFFVSLVEISINSIWSFLSASSSRRIERRRFERILSAFVFLNLITKSSEHIADYLRLFITSVIVNIKGPHQSLRNGRVIFDLTFPSDNIFIAVYHN